jgi:hypothetical protein
MMPDSAALFMRACGARPRSQPPRGRRSFLPRHGLWPLSGSCAPLLIEQTISRVFGILKLDATTSTMLDETPSIKS